MESGASSIHMYGGTTPHHKALQVMYEKTAKCREMRKKYSIEHAEKLIAYAKTPRSKYFQRRYYNSDKAILSRLLYNAKAETCVKQAEIGRTPERKLQRKVYSQAG